VNRALELVLDKADGVTRNGNRWVARCPVPGHEHDDRNKSLSIAEGTTHPVVLKCFTGHRFEDIVAALGLDVGDLMAGGEGGSSTPPKSHTSDGVTIDAYAKHVGLPVAVLTHPSVGLRDFKLSGTPVVRIPYLDRDGEEAAARWRVGLAKDGERFKWRRGSKVMLYGLWRLHDAHEQGGFVFLVEGESDAQVLWHAGFPAVAVPGADNWRDERDAPHLDGIGVVYVVVEPDRGGERVLEWLGRSSIDGRARLVRLDGVKDVRDLWLRDPDKDKFRQAVASAMRHAQPFAAWAAERTDELRQDAWERCRDLAREPNILARFAADLTAWGFAGPASEAQILYLAMSSRVLAKPLCVAVKGPSAAGKSFVVDRVCKFFPGDAYVALSAMSERALVYWDEPLEHRILVIYELAGLGEEIAAYFLRSLISEGRLAYQTVEKTPTGMRGRTIVKDGPTGLILTTVEVAVHAEHETRLLSVTVADTREQTKAIMRALANEHATAPGLGEWHALQEWIARGPREVTIPYGEALAEAVPPLAVRLRRDFGALLGLVRAHALVHQASRERDNAGRIVASIDDYRAVRELIADTIATAVEATVPASVRELVNTVDEHAGENGVTYARLADIMQLDRSAVYRRAARAGSYLRREGKRPKRLFTGDPLPDDVEVLPTPESLLDECARTFGGIKHPPHTPGGEA
jgi:hypothetical protein